MRNFCTSDEEFEAEYVAPEMGMASEVFRKRVLGKAEGQDRWGTISDLALYTLHLDVRVVVIDAKIVTPISSRR